MIHRDDKDLVILAKSTKIKISYMMEYSVNKLSMSKIKDTKLPGKAKRCFKKEHIGMHMCMHAQPFTHVHTCMHTYSHTHVHTYVHTHEMPLSVEA